MAGETYRVAQRPRPSGADFVRRRIIVLVGVLVVLGGGAAFAARQISDSDKPELVAQEPSNGDSDQTPSAVQSQRGDAPMEFGHIPAGYKFSDRDEGTKLRDCIFTHAELTKWTGLPSSNGVPVSVGATSNSCLYRLSDGTILNVDAGESTLGDDPNVMRESLRANAQANSLCGATFVEVKNGVAYLCRNGTPLAGISLFERRGGPFRQASITTLSGGSVDMLKAIVLGYAASS